MNNMHTCESIDLDQIVFYNNRLEAYLKDFYIRHFVKCRKCNRTINPKDGYWFWVKTSRKKGHYHTECGKLYKSYDDKLNSEKFTDELNNFFN